MDVLEFVSWYNQNPNGVLGKKIGEQSTNKHIVNVLYF